MDTLQITTGEKRIAINGDEARVIVFNPTDIIFAEKFYKLISEFETQLTIFQVQSEELDEVKKLDASGLPVNMSARITLMRETCEYIRGKIDYLFGEGTSQKAFGDVMNFEVINQFFDGMAPHIQTARAEKIAKYVTPANGNGKKPRKPRARK